MPELTFKGKEFVYNHHLSVPYRPLQPHTAKSIGTGALNSNLLIHGDNLHALKALLPIYAGSVDVVYIDPPYNTGNEKWSYNDNVNSPWLREWLDSNPVGVEDGLRHDKWLSMMYPRLRLLAELLSPAGTILVSIDDHEADHLRAIMDEIFGEGNFLGSICWKTRNTDNRVKTRLSVDHEYVLVYSRGDGLRGRVVTRENFTNPDNDPRGRYVTDPLTGKAAERLRPNLHYTITNPATGNRYEPDPARGWITDEAGFLELLADGRIWWPPDPRTGKPRKKRFISETSERMPVSTFWSDIRGQSGADELDKIMGKRLFEFPKSLEFMIRLLDVTTSPDSLVLDSFAGSGTTAHAVLALNRRDGGTRRFIIVETEAYAENLTLERVRRAIQGYAFEGTARVEFLRKKITLSTLTDPAELLVEIAGVENLEAQNFDRIRKELSNGTLRVWGEKKSAERMEGLGGDVTYATLGDAVDLDKLLTGEVLPPFEALASVLFYMATNEPYDSRKMAPSSLFGYIGESKDVHVWLIYKPDLDFLKSKDAALTLSLAENVVREKPEKRHLVFAPAKFVSQKLLHDLELPVEFAPLPFALYRIDRS